MTRRTITQIGVAAFCLALLVSSGVAQNQTTADVSGDNQEVLRIAKEVRKQIVTLPQYGVFDYIHFGIKGGDTVVLKGQASRPTLKSGAEKVVSKIEGVTSVDNQIEVLPTSSNDDRIRAAVYASIYRYPLLQKYTSNRRDPEGSHPLPGLRVGSRTTLRLAITRSTSS